MAPFVCFYYWPYTPSLIHWSHREVHFRVTRAVCVCVSSLSTHAYRRLGSYASARLRLCVSLWGHCTPIGGARQPVSNRRMVDIVAPSVKTLIVQPAWLSWEKLCLYGKHTILGFWVWRVGSVWIVKYFIFLLTSVEQGSMVEWTQLFP